MTATLAAAIQGAFDRDDPEERVDSVKTTVSRY
jgi:hypothetical protein